MLLLSFHADYSSYLCPLNVGFIMGFLLLDRLILSNITYFYGYTSQTCISVLDIALELHIQLLLKQVCLMPLRHRKSNKLKLSSSFSV